MQDNRLFWFNSSSSANDSRRRRPKDATGRWAMSNNDEAGGSAERERRSKCTPKRGGSEVSEVAGLDVEDEDDERQMGSIPGKMLVAVLLEEVDSARLLDVVWVGTIGLLRLMRLLLVNGPRLLLLFLSLSPSWVVVGLDDVFFRSFCDCCIRNER